MWCVSCPDWRVSGVLICAISQLRGPQYEGLELCYVTCCVELEQRLSSDEALPHMAQRGVKGAGGKRAMCHRQCILFLQIQYL